MTTGQAPLLMLDLAASHMRDRQRATRRLVSRAALRKARSASTATERPR